MADVKKSDATIQKLIDEAKKQADLAWSMIKWSDEVGDKTEHALWAARWAVWYDVLKLLGEDWFFGGEPTCFAGDLSGKENA